MFSWEGTVEGERENRGDTWLGGDERGDFSVTHMFSFQTQQNSTPQIGEKMGETWFKENY